MDMIDLNMEAAMWAFFCGLIVGATGVAAVVAVLVAFILFYDTDNLPEAMNISPAE